ncbi:hypothetical protein LIX32_07295 [Ralstonia pseudosolanacearum]|nr:hypothetical protein [Ralstonia pseudosolanacearum]
MAAWTVIACGHALAVAREGDPRALGAPAYRHTGIPAYRHTGIPAYRSLRKPEQKSEIIYPNKK